MGTNGRQWHENVGRVELSTEKNNSLSKLPRNSGSSIKFLIKVVFILYLTV